jgi:rsbT co-antagonist protein RsbR
MRIWGAKLTAITSADPDTRRRGRMLVIIALAMALLATAFIPITLLTVRNTGTLLMLVVAPLFYLGAVALGRAGRVNLGSSIVIGISLLAIVYSIANNSGSSNTAYYMVLIVLLAGVLLPPAHSWTALVFTILAMAAGFALLPAESRNDPAFRQSFVGASLLLTMTTLISFLGASATQKAIAAAQSATLEAEHASEALVVSNAALEARVEERTAELRQSAEEQRAAAEQLQASLESQQSLNRVIAELSVPVIPISARTLVVPLVGNIDSTRAQQLLGSIQEQIEGRSARVVVLDVTGVAIVDTQVAAVLLRVATATRLLGAETILVGIRPEVAQTLVNLGVDLATLRTAATLQDGLALSAMEGYR